MFDAVEGDLEFAGETVERIGSEGVLYGGVDDVAFVLGRRKGPLRRHLVWVIRAEPSCGPRATLAVGRRVAKPTFSCPGATWKHWRVRRSLGVQKGGLVVLGRAEPRGLGPGAKRRVRV